MNQGDDPSPLSSVNVFKLVNVVLENVVLDHLKGTLQGEAALAVGGAPLCRVVVPQQVRLRSILVKSVLSVFT